MLTALVDLNGLDISLIERAQLAQQAENEFVGAPTGLMDQAASTLCTAGHALFFDCRTNDAEQVALDLAGAGLELLVLDTKTPHALVDSEYATRRADLRGGRPAARRARSARHRPISTARCASCPIRRCAAGSATS